MRSIKLAIILGLALIAGCSFSAGISRGDEGRCISMERDDFRSVHNATVRLRAYNKKKLAWMGTGCVFKKENGRLYILTNEHVANNADQITAEFRVDGFSIGEYVCDVEFCTQETNIDVAVISLTHGDTLASVPALPMADKPLRVGDQAYWVGCDGGRTQNGQIARIVYSSDELFYMNPKAVGGDSGSSVVQFDNRGNPYIVGLIAWVGQFENRQVAMAQPSRVVMGIIEGSIKPELELPPSLEESDKVMQGLLERLRNLRSDQQRDFKTLVERLRELELKRANQAEETQRFRDLWRKQQEDNAEQGKGLQESIIGQFNTLKQLIAIAKYSFYALVIALLVSIFAGQGWLTRLIVTIFKVVYHTIRGAAAIIADAISRPIKKTESPAEALDNLREEIGDAFEDES